MSSTTTHNVYEHFGHLMFEDVGMTRLRDNGSALMTALAAVFAVPLLTGCSSHYSVGDLVGQYVLSVDGGVDTLTLNANGTYTDAYKAKNEQGHYQTGRWTLESLQAGTTVALNNFLPPPGINDQRHGIYLLLVRKSFGSLYLITNIDLDEGYKRQS